MAKNDIVTIHCYGNTERLPRQKAIMKYFAGMCNSEGSERDRYTNIYIALINGEKECYD